MTPEAQAQAVLIELEKDPNMGRGTRRVWEDLRFHGIELKRCAIIPTNSWLYAQSEYSDFVRKIMVENEAEGFARRAPGQKVIKRTPLLSVGPDEEWSMDGHDKLAKAGFGVYGIRDKYSGRFLHYRILCSNRYALVVGITFLECIKKYGRTSSQSSLLAKYLPCTNSQGFQYKVQQTVAQRQEMQLQFLKC